MPFGSLNLALSQRCGIGGTPGKDSGKIARAEGGPTGFTPEMEVFYMLFKRGPTKNKKRFLKQLIKYFCYRSIIQLDHRV